MNSTKLQILNNAYRLFLSDNIEKVTISRLEEATQRVRGAIFYHFESKQKIFESVVNEMFLPSFQLSSKIIDSAHNSSLEIFIETYKCPEERVISQIKDIFNMEDAEICYNNLFSQAYRYCPDFKHKYKEVLNDDLFLWKTALQKAKKDSTQTECEIEKAASMLMFAATGIALKKQYFQTGIKREDLLVEFCLYLLK